MQLTMRRTRAGLRPAHQQNTPVKSLRSLRARTIMLSNTSGRRQRTRRVRCPVSRTDHPISLLLTGRRQRCSGGYGSSNCGCLSDYTRSSPDHRTTLWLCAVPTAGIHAFCAASSNPVVSALCPDSTYPIGFLISGNATTARILRGSSPRPPHVPSPSVPAPAAAGWQHHPLVGVDGRRFPGSKCGAHGEWTMHAAYDWYSQE
jgi:hypothetical protein